MEQQIYSISQINAYIRSMMDADSLLGSLAIRGEISNYKVYPSGHHYFTLKDESSALKCVMFRTNTLRLKFRPENGMKIIAMGSISVYPRDGAYQLYCTAMVVDGVGDLHTAFEQLKTKLAEQGLFDPSHKMKIPSYPGVIGIITSEAGAAVHDILKILKKRYPLSKVILLPVRVQGAEAPAEISAAIRYANHYALADVLIVGRGGGSVEDLWAFNDENLARVIYDSKIPVISAVGHEPDVTISDYVADVRAATPSNAAELVVPDKQALQQTLDSLYLSMRTITARRLKEARTQLLTLASCSVLQGPSQYIDQKRKALMITEVKLLNALQFHMNIKKQHFVSLTSKLDAMSPLKVLTRGYAIAQSHLGNTIRSIHQISCGDNLSIRLSDGSLEATITGIKGG